MEIIVEQKPKQMSKYIESQLMWKYTWSRSKTAVYHSRNGRYYLSEDGTVYLYEKDKDYHGAMGDVVGHVTWNK